MPTPYWPALRQCKSFGFANLGKEFVWYLNQNACTITGVWLASRSAAMIHIFQRGQGLAHDGMRTAALHVGNKTGATSVVLKSRIIQPLFGGRSVYLAFCDAYCVSFISLLR